MSTASEQAPAKINLTLEILGRRADGYHELTSLVAFARDAFDVVGLRPGQRPSLAVCGPFAGAILGENIMQRAIRAIGAIDWAQLHLGAVTLDKRLPIASGIGGGSADAAALLRAVRQANVHIGTDQPWLHIASGLGADVPACFANVAAMLTGTGTRVEPLAHFPTLNAVLANPMVAVPADKTAQVFGRLALAPAGMPSSMPAGRPHPTFKCPSDVLAYLDGHTNQLTDAARAIVPMIDTVLAALSGLRGCRLARMSGAGPTCFGLFQSAAAAEAAMVALHAAHPTWWIKASRLN